MALTEDQIRSINEKLLFKLPPIKSDVGLVFGQGVYSLLFVPEIVSAIARQKFPKVIISGGAKVLDTPDAALLIAFLKSKNVPENQLPNEHEKEADYIFRLLPAFAKAVSVCETASLNTGENIDNSRHLGLDEANSITVIASASMIARAIASLRMRYNSCAKKPISSIPVYPPGIDAGNWMEPQNAFAANSMLGEFRKLDKYTQQGLIAPISIPEEIRALYDSGLILK